MRKCKSSFCSCALEDMIISREGFQYLPNPHEELVIYTAPKSDLITFFGLMVALVRSRKTALICTWALLWAFGWFRTIICCPVEVCSIWWLWWPPVLVVVVAEGGEPCWSIFLLCKDICHNHHIVLHRTTQPSLVILLRGSTLGSTRGVPSGP